MRVYDLLRSARVVGPTTLERVRQRLTFSGQPSLKAIVALSTALERAGPSSQLKLLPTDGQIALDAV